MDSEQELQVLPLVQLSLLNRQSSRPLGRLHLIQTPPLLPPPRPARGRPSGYWIITCKADSLGLYPGAYLKPILPCAGLVD
jgi:hypothetical protein